MAESKPAENSWYVFGWRLKPPGLSPSFEHGTKPRLWNTVAITRKARALGPVPTRVQSGALPKAPEGVVGGFHTYTAMNVWPPLGFCAKRPYVRSCWPC